MHQYPLLSADALAECGEVCDQLAEAIDHEFHGDRASAATPDQGAKLTQVQVDAIHLGKPKLSVEAQVRHALSAQVGDWKTL